MGEFGHNETVWVISEHRELCRTSDTGLRICIVCGNPIKTKTHFELNDTLDIPDKLIGEPFCHSCAKKLMVRKESRSF